MFSGCPRNLELHLEGHCAPEVGHLVIENALVRLACCKRTHSAHRKIFVHTIVCGKRENFADVVAASFVILPHYERAHGIDEKGAGENRRVAKIDRIIASLGRDRIDVWRLSRFLGRDANIQVGAQRERLSATKSKRNPRVYNEGVVLEESRKAVFLGEPIVIVLGAQKQIVPLRHEISEADFNIKASKIKVVESIVIKQLLPDIDQSVQRTGNSRLVKGCYCRRNHKVALLSAPRKGNIRGPVKGRASRNRERLILVGALEDLLFAKICVARRGGDIATFGTAWRNRGREG